MTKPAIQSKELWVIWMTIFITLAEQLKDNPNFVMIMGDKMFIFTTISLLLVAFLRHFRTTKAIKGMFTTPKVPPPDITKSESRNISATDILEDELQANDDFTRGF